MLKIFIKITFAFAVFCVLLNSNYTLVKSQKLVSKDEIKTEQVELPNRLFGLTIAEYSLSESFEKPIPDLIENILNELRKLKAEQKGNNNSLTVRIVLPVECLKKINNKCLEFGDPNKLEEM